MTRRRLSHKLKRLLLKGTNNLYCLEKIVASSLFLSRALANTLKNQVLLKELNYNKLEQKAHYLSVMSAQKELGKHRTLCRLEQFPNNRSCIHQPH